MPPGSNRLSQFWQELKRRKVTRTITVYAAAAFVILELVSIIVEPLKLPEWTLPMIIVLLCIGFIIAVIISWIYDIHPEEGIVKTEPAHKAKEKDKPVTSNSWKIASYISFVVIVVLIVLNVIPRAAKKEILDKSIAVLPFKNESSDQENTYFINGMMESILDNLSRIEDMRVVSRNSVEQYRDDPKPTPAVAEEMDVSYVLEGSGQKVGNRLLLTVQLIVGHDDRHIWSKQYDRVIERVEDLIDIQKEIAELVVNEIEAIITPDEKELIESVPTTSLTAYDFYQRGAEEEIKGNTDRAEELFRTALKYDSAYANAYVGLAGVFWRKHYWETYFEEDFLDSVLILADIALSIDDKLSDAYTIRGNYYIQVGELDLAIEEFDLALLYNPNNGWAYVFGGRLYASSDLVKSIQYYHKALALIRGDQLPEMLENVGWAYLENGFIEKSKYYYSEAFKLTKDSLRYFNRLRLCEFVSANFSDAIEYLKKVYALDSTNYNYDGSFGEYYMMNGDYMQSLQHYNKWLEKTNSLSQHAVFGMHRVGWAYWMNGLKEEGEVFFKKQIEYNTRLLELGRVINEVARNYYDLAATYAFIGDKDKAFENLRFFEKYQTANRWFITYINNDPLFDSIRDEPEFQQIVRDVEAKYQAEHDRVRQWLEENDML